MAKKKRPSDKTELRVWMDEQYRKTPGLQKRVEALAEELSNEQDLIRRRKEKSRRE
jgi:hypothetical protein